jgi:hypothetical protein
MPRKLNMKKKEGKERMQEKQKEKQEKKKKKEQQRLEDKIQRKEERKPKIEARRKRREARTKKEEEAKTTNASSSEMSGSLEDGDDNESYQVTKGSKKEKKGKGKANTNNKYAAVSFNYTFMPMTNHDRRSFINVPAGKLLISIGLTLPSGST